MLQFLTLLADGEKGTSGSALLQFVPFILIIIVFYFVVLRPAKRREQLQREQFLATLKKNDKVLTSGGIIGVIANVNEKEDEVTLKIDESSNVRIRVLKNSVIKNYTAEEALREQAAKEQAAKGKDEAVTAGKS
jgi:preprotein translocase subunit YajC